MKKLIALLLALALCFGMVACSTEQPEDPGVSPSENSGSEPSDDPATPEPPQEIQKNAAGLYEIYTAEHLVQYRDIVENEMRVDYQSSGHSCKASSGAILMDDIDMSTVCNAQLGSWRPIGFEAVTKRSGSLESGDMYSLLFDGNNHTISGLYISGGSNGALFFSLWEAEVRNLTFADTSIIVDSGKAATLAINMKDGILKNIQLESTVSVHMAGTTTDYHTIGGIVAYAREHNSVVTIENCKNYGKITTAASNKCDLGGIVGATNRTVDVLRCENHGEVSSSGTGNAIIGVKMGGIVGRADGESYYLGRIFGCVNYGTIRNSHPEHGYTGGIVGHSESSVAFCVNMGSVSGNALSRSIGVDDGHMYSCLNVGSVTGENVFLFDKDTNGISVSAGDASLTDGSLVSRLNGLAEGAYWTQGDAHPIWSGLE